MKKRVSSLVAFAATMVLLHACGGGSGEDSAVDVIVSAPVGDAPDAPPNGVPGGNSASEVPVDPINTGMFADLNSTVIGGDAEPGENADLTGLFIPTIFETATTVDLAYAQAGSVLVEQLNESLLLPTDVNVIFADCGTANAFFVPAPIAVDDTIEVTPGSVFMCHELTELFSNFYDTPEQGFLANSFVLMHEIGHALVKVLELPVVGQEEGFVDAVGAVFLGESGLAEGSVLAGWFFASQGATPFFDTHRAGPQRLGDLACWGIGADPSLVSDPIVASISEQLIGGGRDCVTEYAQQLSALSQLLDGSIVGGLGTDIP